MTSLLDVCGGVVGGAAREAGTPTRVPEFTCDFAFKVAQQNCGSGGGADENI